MIYKNSAIVDNVKEFFDLPQEDINENGVYIDRIDSIIFKNVYYKYRDDGEYILKNINLSINKGNFIIVMGYNGSGKTTFIKLIMGLYNDYEGDIFINGIDLRTINIESYRNKISALFQNYIRYEMSILDNVSLGNLRQSDNLNKINELLKKVNLNNLGECKDDNLGYRFNDGRQISLGQWQKIALARTLIKDAELYVFDEPNASLDLVSEAEVFTAIHEHIYNKMGIIIMHRFNNIILKSDKIIVLNNGEIAEEGTHYELIKNREIYY